MPPAAGDEGAFGIVGPVVLEPGIVDCAPPRRAFFWRSFGLAGAVVDGFIESVWTVSPGID